MPELAEVELSRRFWMVASDDLVREVRVHGRARIFRETCGDDLVEILTGAQLVSSRSHGKRMFFEFSRKDGKRGFLEVHLGMSGRMLSRPLGAMVAEKESKHDHLVLVMDTCELVLNDYRMFGKVVWHELGLEGEEPWMSLPIQVQERGFNEELVAELLRRRERAVFKAVMLDQSVCPGVGNWMADEACWRMGVYPGVRMKEVDLATFVREMKFVCRGALKHVADANEKSARKVGAEGFSPGNYVKMVPPKSWLFQHRWKKGGSCPRCGKKLERETIAGRTTAWCSLCQVK